MTKQALKKLYKATVNSLEEGVIYHWLYPPCTYESGYVSVTRKGGDFLYSMGHRATPNTQGEWTASPREIEQYWNSENGYPHLYRFIIKQRFNETLEKILK